MKKIFDYNGKIKNDLYFDDLKLENTSSIISACTVPNSDGKPNEDSFAIVEKEDILWIGIFDGTTSLRVLETLKGVSGAKFASAYLKKHFAENVAGASRSPAQVLLNLNSMLFKKSEKLGGKLDDTHSLPAAMATILKISFSNKKMEMAHAGDTWVIIYDKNGGSKVITDNKNKAFDDEIFRLIRKIASEKGLTNRQARHDDLVNRSLYEMYFKRNNSPTGKGSGLVNGDPNLEMYIQEKQVDLSNKQVILAGSDGLEIQGQELSDDNYRNLLLKNLTDDGFKKIIEIKRQSEDDDPEWENIRYKHSDDATGILIKLNQKF